MIIINQSNVSALPSHVAFQPSSMRSLPVSAEMGDFWKNGGSGVSNRDHAVPSAFGEYFERRHFYMEIYPDKHGRLADVLTEEEIQNFTFAFSQTTNKKRSTTDIHKHHFNLSEVRRSSDFSTCYIPSICLSLSACKMENDLYIHPLRDTCGCCFHHKPDLAILGSLKEQLERQFLARFWLTKECKKIINHESTLALLHNNDIQRLYKLLNKSGEITIIDISDNNFPGACVLAVYGNRDNSRRVKYCAGMAYSNTTTNAIEKSILELWQTFRFMDLHYAVERPSNEIEDPYLKYFLNCNDYQTYLNIIEAESVPIDHPPSAKKFTFQEMISALHKAGINGYIYIKAINIDGDCYYASKYISPNLFLHMNNSKNINLNNTYSQSFLKKIKTDRKNVMVPFP